MSTQFPPLNPTYSRDLTFHQHLINYISTCLSTGIYTRIPSFYSPTRRDITRLIGLWVILYTNHREEIERKLRGGRRVPDDSLESTLGGLKVHSLSLEEDPHVNITPYELRSLLPNLTSQTSSLLSTPPFKPFGQIDAEVLALAQWFKQDYMRWIDPIPCPKCHGPTSAIGSSEPSPAERADGAGRVELHKCVDGDCGEIRRFCRYGRIKALIRTREGRCGEWAQLFYCFSRVRGVECRYVWNSEDHVWCEYWSPTLQHWVHVDPCEAAINKPLLYARGWGKKQAFCLAFGPYGAEDVTRAYVDDWEECKNRRRAKGWKELDLRRALYAHTVSLRLRLPHSERTRLEAMDTLQSLWMADEAGRLAESEKMDLGGRISGPEDWRAMRDELGLGGGKVELPRYSTVQSLSISNDQLLKFGNARVQSSSILLTDGPSQTSAIFHPNPIPLRSNFRSKVKFRLTSDRSGEADGIALIFLREPPDTVGLRGYGMGYDGLGGEGDFAIEVDTYRTQDHASDPPTPHISLHSPPKAHHRYSLECTKPGSIPFLSDGREYELEVIFRSSSSSTPDSKVTRRVRGYLHTPDGEVLQVIDVDLLAQSQEARGDGGEEGWYLGISGACGGLWQRQEILVWKIELIEFVSQEAVESDGKEDRKEEVNLEKDQV
ncbi:hypothetical protein I302_102064 [Kwoniella bestiolae CBS 10118]|uniref:Transglutaminase-like domain-containing protein n=1 Tax=Kwoniella bestiolae CBS 10118 TaxID=1296100 RepID=A0A1B9GDY9_9TREE|nr:hypothetical protein I302_00749 [Kwoniella bestiolae CBS 10118]OCF29253.1 hypothetical protein I302_00749 [Kwoniella bestiolae CBS 10118]